VHGDRFDGVDVSPQPKHRVDRPATVWVEPVLAPFDARLPVEESPRKNTTPDTRIKTLDTSMVKGLITGILL
jgi:hypothetical protein